MVTNDKDKVQGSPEQKGRIPMSSAAAIPTEAAAATQKVAMPMDVKRNAAPQAAPKAVAIPTKVAAVPQKAATPMSVKPDAPIQAASTAASSWLVPRDAPKSMTQPRKQLHATPQNTSTTSPAKSKVRDAHVRQKLE